MTDPTFTPAVEAFLDQVMPGIEGTADEPVTDEAWAAKQVYADDVHRLADWANRLMNDCIDLRHSLRRVTDEASRRYTEHLCNAAEATLAAVRNELRHQAQL